ncbi:hypothetical protein I3843_05G204300 [Carya illinoinensis]|uniref:Uncharacterized protein n=1 Tax=Carya illinoinensis TaxID=32201 RepID=A0A8T1QMV3_CARIL|nr:hypothetical protein I3760_05G224600 [Carya illinoinensis]KAG6655591.1 hypothetical protein CIPAW_05G227700 [Carya illinoinensis]KAG6714842.1 hypothetical protein I3842_05G221900 [Carya illinoinensis]KAG7980853.1 hypothetical protein I3843_05G204300 [Carya illinoinensis]
MKCFPAFPLLVLFFLVLSSGTTLGEAQSCSEPTLHILYCTKQTCVQSCVETHGRSINGGCIDENTCCCLDVSIYEIK